MDHINQLFKNITEFYNNNTTPENQDNKTQYIDNNSSFITTIPITNRSIISESNNKLSFAYLENLCKSNDEDYISKELQTIQEYYDANKYQNWLLTEITVITALNPNCIGLEPDNPNYKLTKDYHLSPIEYVVHKENFNIAKQLIDIVELQQQNSGAFLQFLINKYLTERKNYTAKSSIDSFFKTHFFTNSEEQNNNYYKIKDIIYAAVKVYATTNINLLELIPLFVATINKSEYYFLSRILDIICNIKFENNCVDEIKLFYKNISNNQDLNDSIKKKISVAILCVAIEYKNIGCIMMILKENIKLFFETKNYYFTLVANEINDYTVMIKCLEYIKKNGYFEKFSFRKSGFMSMTVRKKILADGSFTFVEYIRPSRYLLNYCIKKQYNDNALAIIVQGANITYDGNEDEDIIDKSQMALLIAIQCNNINMIKILKGLNAMQCNAYVILQSSFFCDYKGYCTIKNIEEIEYILSNPLPLKEIISIRFAFNLLKQLNHQENINLKFIKEYIKEKYLLPPSLVNKIQSIEDLFFLS